MFAPAGRVTALDALGQAPDLDRQLAAILAEPSRCDLTRDLQVEISSACDQLLVSLAYPGRDAPTNSGSERLLCRSAVQRKATSGCRAMWAATGEACILAAVDTARLACASPFGTILKTNSARTRRHRRG